MKNLTLAALAAAALAVPASAMQDPAPRIFTVRGKLTFFDHVNYQGQAYEVEEALSRFFWRQDIRSIAIHPGDRWQICVRPRFAECIVLDRSVADAERIGLRPGSTIGSVRPAPADAHN